MKNKLIMLLFGMMIAIAGSTACGTSTVDHPVTTDSGKIFLDVDYLVEIGDCVYYDPYTGVAYWWNGNMKTGHSNTSPTPYYSPNGYLYRYIPETNTLEEILPKED